ncbi:MAG: hypothetical protein IKX97_03675 [Erysipelotrichaceae bacterium]|nr:hypothetical protein [Erysipelotrichaceae bacterium]
MIRTNTVKLSVIKAMAFRQKLASGGSGITIIRPDYSQPGIASISTKTGEVIPTKNCNRKMFPDEAFAEAMELTRGMPYKNQRKVKVDGRIFEEEAETEEIVKEEVFIDSKEYQKIIDKYSDKNGRLSYDLMNKDFIKFAKTSDVVAQMVSEKKSAASIRNYVISSKLRSITGNRQLGSKELKKIVELLDEVSPKGVYKELNSEIRKLLNAGKRK